MKHFTSPSAQPAASIKMAGSQSAEPASAASASATAPTSVSEAPASGKTPPTMWHSSSTEASGLLAAWIWPGEKLYAGREGFAVLALATSLGILARFLLFQAEWGIGATIWFLAFAVTLIGFATEWSLRVPRNRWWIAGSMLILPLAFAWRTSETLALATLAAFTTMSGVWIGTMALGRDESTRFIRLLAKLGWLFPQFVGAHLNAKRTGILDESEAWRSALRGAVLALPVLVVFGALLADADDRFASFLVLPAHINLDRWAPIVVQILFATAVSGTFLLGTTRFLRGQELVRPLPLRLTVNAIEAHVIVGLVSLLFAAFLGVQFYGTALDGLANSELSSNAREGFFQLVIVAAISLGLVTTLGHRLRAPGDGKTEAALHPYFGLLVAFNGALVLGILASAALRMYAYTSALGWTVLRVNATFAMVWTAVLFVAVIVKHLSDAHFNLARVGIATALVLLGSMHVMNPDAFIAAHNIDRGSLTTEDIRLLRSLSPDAIPAIEARFDKLDAAAQEEIERSWQVRLASGVRDWRSWSVGETRLRAQVGRQHNTKRTTQTSQPAPTIQAAQTTQTAQTAQTVQAGQTTQAARTARTALTTQPPQIGQSAQSAKTTQTTPTRTTTR